MAKKVEGWTTEWAVDDAIRNGSGIELRRSEIKPLSTVKATLVIGDERVFTESEVRELVDTLCAIPNFIPHKPLAETLKQTMREVSNRYFDPA